jgi:hypothetical protein
MRVLLLSMLLAAASPSFGQDAEWRIPSPERLPGSAISDSNQAARIAEAAFEQKMRRRMLAEEGSQASVVRLGYSVKGFGSRGDLVWEVRISELVHDLKAIVWVHSETGAALPICGAWDGNERAIAN